MLIALAVTSPSDVQKASVQKQMNWYPPTCVDKQCMLIVCAVPADTFDHLQLVSELVPWHAIWPWLQRAAVALEKVHFRARRFGGVFTFP